MIVRYCGNTNLDVCLFRELYFPSENSEMLKKIANLFSKKQPSPLPLLIIKKNAGDENVKEYTSVDEAIADLESDPNVPAHKIEKLRMSLKEVKNKSTIRIRNGEIVK